MKKLLAALALSIPAAVFAQQRIPLPVICAEPPFVEKVIREHKEEMLFVGKDTVHGVENLTVNIFLNTNTGTYSIVLVAPDASFVCVVGSGVQGKLIYKN